MVTVQDYLPTTGHTISNEWAQRVHAARAILRSPHLKDLVQTEDVINLAYGNSIRRPHVSVIVEAVRSVIDCDRYSLEDYKTLEDDSALLAAVQRFFERFGVHEATNGNIVIEAGSTSLFANFCHSYFEGGGVLLCPRGYYHELPAWCEKFSLEFSLIDTRREDEFKVTSQALLSWLSKSSGHARELQKALVLANPTVTGAVYSESELESVSKLASENGIFLVYDIVYAETVFPGIEMAAFPATRKDADNTLVLSSVSKSYGLANVRVGWGCGPEHLIQKLTLYRELTMGTVPFPNQIMAEAALNAPVAYVKNSAAECQRRFLLVEDLIKNLNIEIFDNYIGPFEDFLKIVHEPHAAHSVLLSIPALKGLWSPLGGSFTTSLDLSSYLISKAQLIVSPANSMGFDDMEFRLCFGPIGHSYTHGEAIEIERDAVLQVLKNPRTTFQEDTVPERGFLKGRMLLEKAFEERLLPALRDVLDFNSVPRRTYSAT